ncbi:hypothetical protein FIU87_11925 [Bacillus sp. THAF10]|uniref:YppE family protein n=1 Tax=Bacillus sp. THAF10 TaxID=2587848 RepID=UPI0012A83A33|nr:YppE family protein [Bacillus sp. THAF10]QFT89356.1 hypothetical protein FIU87_11925 [Bacillus sp. THAF10]
MTSEHNELISITEKLCTFINKIEMCFEKTQQRKEEPDFFATVKPFADDVYQTVKAWEDASKKWITSQRPKNIHIQQIDSTVENINMVSVQCFYPDTKSKRFKGMIQSIHYVLEDILNKAKA